MPKLEHGLVYFDVSPDDKQNFKSLTKCSDVRVRNALCEHVPDSEGTAFYLQLCAKIASSLMDHDIIPQERIELIFHVVYFLRIWKKWIRSSGYNMKNFITNNAYICIEINAANLLKLIRRFRDEEKQELFLTTLFDSQACERGFRQLRSMNTPNFRKVNFTLLELLHMTRRIEVQNDILYTKLPNVNLPKLEKCKEKTKIYALPSEQEISDCLDRAKRFAVADALKFGMDVASNEIDECELNIPKKLVNDEDVEEADIENESNADFEQSTTCETLDETDFPEIYDDDETIQHGFLQIEDPKNPNKKLVLRKSTFVWHLTEGTKKISADRLIRVQNTGGGKNQQQTVASSKSRDSPSVLVNEANALKHIGIGDWCVFKTDRSDSGSSICFGSMLAFKFANGKTANEKKYKGGDSVDLREFQNTTTKDLEVLSSWYNMSETGYLTPMKKENHFFINIKNYVATVAKPKVDVDTKSIFYSDFKQLENDILNILN